MKNNKHTIWHQIFMIFYKETTNIMWLALGIVLSAAGFLTFTIGNLAFWRVGVGLPLVLIGFCLVFFKIHEIIVVVVKPKEVAAICVLCNGENE